MLDRHDLERFLPGVRLGAEVSGASLRPRDGHVNPLRLLAALQRSFTAGGGTLRCGHPVSRLLPRATASSSRPATSVLRRRALVIAAGLASGDLAALLGIAASRCGRSAARSWSPSGCAAPAAASERPAPDGDGTVMIGATQEEVGLDTATTVEAAPSMSRARRPPSCRHLARATLVRQWAGLRVMTPDSYPVYAQSRSASRRLRRALPFGRDARCRPCRRRSPKRSLPAGCPPISRPFHHRRFDVPKAA